MNGILSACNTASPKVGYSPLSKGGAINEHYAVLHKGLGSHKFIVTGIIHHIQDTALVTDGCKNEENDQCEPVSGYPLTF